MDRSTRLTLFLNANLVRKVHKELRKVVRNSFGACWTLRVATPQLLHSDCAVMTPAHDSQILPVSMVVVPASKLSAMDYRTAQAND